MFIIQKVKQRGVNVMKKKLALVLACLGLSLGVQGLFNTGLADEDEVDYPAEPIVFTKPVKAVVFDHRLHMEDAGLDCDSCHDDIFEQATGTAEENGDFTMKSLYDGKYCGACHDGDTAFASDTRCAVCHIGVMGYNRMHKVEGVSQGGHH